MTHSLETMIFALALGGFAPLSGCTSDDFDVDSDVDAAQAESDPWELDEAAALAELELTSPTRAAEGIVAEGTFYYVRAKHSDRCLHQHGAVHHNGGAITQWKCIDQYNVQWEFEPSPEPDYYYIKARHSGKCAHQHGHTHANGDPITQWDCIDQGNVKVKIIPAGNNYYYLQFKHSGKCIHVQGASWANGAPITQWSCINQPNVQWTFEPVGH